MQGTASNIDTLFVTLAATYGAAWDRSLGTAPLVDVKTVWGSHLSGFILADILYALDHLSAKCPNVFEFRDLCRASPKKEALRLDVAAPSPAVVAEEIAKQTGLKQVINASHVDGKEWARRIKARKAAGDRTVSRYAEREANIALGLSGKQEAAQLAVVTKGCQ